MKTRGFEIVKDAHRQHKTVLNMYGEYKEIYAPITLPTRSDPRSAGYDFYAPIDIQLLPAQKTILWLDVKAYMGEDEVLNIYPRSSMGIKNGLMLSNTVGIIDASYYENPGNDGNIGLALLNTSGISINIKKGDRIAQGIFTKYLLADNDAPTSDIRVGGMGSSGN